LVKLKNLNEELINNVLKDLIGRLDFCSCERCRLDILALSLNQLPPRYVVTGKGDSYSRAEMLELQKGVDILSMVVSAIKTVQSKPRHDAEE